MFTELPPFHDHAAAAIDFARLIREIRASKGFDNRVLDWLNSAITDGPTLLFDIGNIEQRMRWLADLSRPLQVSPLLAVKSGPFPEYLAAGNRHLGGFDISNATEYALLPDQAEGKLVFVTSPGLNLDFNRLVSKGNTTVIVLDSAVQLERYLQEGAPMPYVLRIRGSDLLKDTNPGDPAYYSESRFGFPIEQLEKILEDPKLAVSPSGFHVHHGSEMNRVSTYRTMIHGLKHLAERLPAEPRYVNLGGGWHNMSRDELRAVLQEARQAFPLPCAIAIEPGRWYAEESGFAIGTIVNQISSSDTIKYVVNLSKQCHLRWSEVRLTHPVDSSARKLKEVQFFGPTCYEEDRIGNFLLPYRADFLPESGLVTGSRVLFSRVSTYSAAWNTSFNGIPEAEVIWWGNG